MTLAARCPTCGTVFRVVEDQLRVSEGWVRCGRCSEVFNAIETLVEVDAQLPPPRPRPSQAPVARATPPVAAPEPAPVTPAAPPVWAPEPSVAMPARAPAPEPPPAPRRTDATAWPLPGTGGDGAGDDDAWPPLPGRPEGPPPATWRPVADAPAPAPAPTASAPASATASTATASTVPPWPPAAAPEAPLEPPLEPPLEVPFQAPPDRATPLAAPTAAAAAATPLGLAGAPLPSFLAQAQRADRWQRPGVRAALVALATVLSLTLAAQALLAYRDVAAARWPALAPALQAACEHIGCTLAPPRVIEALVVEHSALLQRDAESGGGYRLALALRNRATWALQAPSVDLTLTDLQGGVIARRVLGPADFALPPGQPVPAGGSLAWETRISVADAAVSGYTIEIFYP